MFKKRAGLFYRFQNDKAKPSGFRPNKIRAASFLNCLKNIPGKACVNRVHSNRPFYSCVLSDLVLNWKRGCG